MKDADLMDAIESRIAEHGVFDESRKLSADLIRLVRQHTMSDIDEMGVGCEDSSVYTGNNLHTLGPWRIDQGTSYDRVYGPMAHSGRLADVHSYGSGYGPNAIERLANARLMAAAPDLLEGLRSYLREVYRGHVSIGTDRACRAAIAKATGLGDQP